MTVVEDTATGHARAIGVAASQVYVSGAFVAAADARVSVFDRGFLYGDGIFETVRAYGGRVFRADAHFDRIAVAAAGLEIPLPFDRPGFGNLLAECLARNGLEQDGMLRCTVTRGEGIPVPDPSGAGAPTVVVFPRPVVAVTPEEWVHGLAVATVPVQAMPPGVLDPAWKTVSFLSHVRALAAAKAAGADEALLRDGDGNVAEGSISNLFAVVDGVLMTPDLTTVLPGVTRAEVLHLARRLEIPVREARIPATVFGHADEVFATNTGWEIRPVTRLDGEPVGNGTAGPITRRLYAAFRECTGQGPWAVLDIA